MSRWISIGILVLIGVLVAGGIVIFRRSSTPPPPTIIANQIYVSQVSNTSLQFVSAEKVTSQSTDGDLLDAKGRRDIHYK